MSAAEHISQPDGRLLPADIEQITGIPSDRPVRQRNQLRRWGIRAEVNARREVVCFWSWVAAAALPEPPAARYIAPSPAAAAPEDIGMNLGALRRGKTPKA